MNSQTEHLKAKHKHYLATLDNITEKYLTLSEEYGDDDIGLTIRKITEELMLYGFHTDNMTCHMINIIEKLESK